MDNTLLLAAYQAVAGNAALTQVDRAIAEFGIALLPVALAVYWLVRRGDRAVLTVAILAGLLAALVAAGLGFILERQLDYPRPFVALGLEPLIAHAADASFPSDHTLVGVALVAPLAWLRQRWGSPLVLWALVVGGARVAAALHYPRDILGSAILGGLLAAAALDLVRFAYQRAARAGAAN